MTGYVGNIEQLTLSNTYFRQVLYTGQFTQLVLMSLLPNEDIGEEVHEGVDQFFRIEEGEGKVVINGKETTVKGGDVIIVPSMAKHNLINTSSTQHLKLYTLYSPPHHKDGVIHKTKKDAENE